MSREPSGQPCFYARGMRHAHAKLTDDQVRQIRAARLRGEETLADIGRRFGVSHSMVSRITRRKNWRHI